jgi:hypothetical protein
MPSAQVALATITLGSAQSTITFASIPATYRDLRLVIQGSLSAGSNYFKLNFNGDSGANYNYVFMRGDGTSATSSASSNDVSIYQTPSSIGSGVNTMISADIFDYGQTDKHKSTLTRSHSDGVYVWAIAGRWANTAAVTSVAVAAYSGNLNTGTVISLYGIAS